MRYGKLRCGVRRHTLPLPSYCLAFVMHTHGRETVIAHIVFIKSCEWNQFEPYFECRFEWWWSVYRTKLEQSSDFRLELSRSLTSAKCFSHVISKVGCAASVHYITLHYTTGDVYPVPIRTGFSGETSRQLWLTIAALRAVSRGVELALWRFSPT
jgi:hypothetical protein